MRRLLMVIVGAALVASCASPAPIASPAASAPASHGPNHVEIWNRTLDPVLVTVGGSIVRVDACGYVVVDGAHAAGQVQVEKQGGGYFWSSADQVATPAPAPNGRFLVVVAHLVNDLRQPPADLPSCEGHVGPQPTD
jgi:opacity protein-like surface antigen